MRLVGTLAHENDARRLTYYLASQGISNRCEVIFEAATTQMSYQIWVHEEDKIQIAASIFKEFERHPSDHKFDAPAPAPEPPSEPIVEEDVPPPHRFKAHLTHFLISLCALVFFLNMLQQASLSQRGLSEKNLLLLPMQAPLMYDLPPAFEQWEKALEEYEISKDSQLNLLPALKERADSAIKTPYWKGIYNWVLFKFKGEDSSSGEGELFIKLRQGEFWRLITPCILHSDLLHVLFNMLWLWYLGRPIEQRIGPFRMLLFTLVAGIGSNTLQYLMSGPFFIGYSGIVTALAGFIWMRERVAPWEGYPLNRATLLFLLFFIGAIFALQMSAFLIQIFSSYQFSPNIANTAHIAGAVIGAVLAKSRFFAERVKR